MGLSVKANQARALLSLAFATTDEIRHPKMGNWLKKRERKLLVDSKLVELDKQGRTTYVVLSDRGWSWVAEHLGSAVMLSTTPADRVLGSVLSRLHVYLERHGDSLQAFLDVVPANDQQKPQLTSKTTRSQKNERLEERIRSVAFELGGNQVRKRVRLRDLRQRLKDVARPELDRALFALQDEGGLVLYRIDDPNDVSIEDERAALQVAGFPRHILYLER